MKFRGLALSEYQDISRRSGRSDFGQHSGPDDDVRRL